MEKEQDYLEEDVIAAKEAGKTLRRFLRSMGKQRVRLVIVIFSVAAYTTFNILAPLYSASAVDLIWNRIRKLRETGQNFAITWEDGGKQIVFLLLLYAAASGFYTLQNFLMASFAERLSLQLRSEVSEKLHRLPLSFYDRHQPGIIMSCITNDLDKMSEALQTGMIRLFVAVGVVAGSIIMMLRFSVLLTVVFLGFAGVSLLLTQVVSRRTLRCASRRQNALGKLNGLVEEAYSGRTVIQAFFQYANQAGEPITELSYMINAMQSALASVERVYTLLDEEEMTPDVQRSSLPDEIKGSITFSHVQFGYVPDKILMSDVSFTAKPGQKIAIVGSTGAGKTTLVNLLMRFYEVSGGSILLDGRNTSDMARAQLRSCFGMVLQDAWLFEGTIAENIAYGKPDATREQIIAAAKAARADFFIRTLPHGYDTMLGSDAENISIGQRQLLTIARVFLCDPEILILDEATSSVDTRTEMEIGKAMKALMKGRTSFVIAHRLSTIVDADLILVMQNGTIIEQGSHRELLQADGAYAELYNGQFA